MNLDVAIDLKTFQQATVPSFLTVSEDFLLFASNFGVCLETLETLETPAKNFWQADYFRIRVCLERKTFGKLNILENLNGPAQFRI